MSDTISSILCSDTLWWWSNDNTITFNEDGTGELICRFEVRAWIAAEFHWKAKDASQLTQVVHTKDGSQKSTQQLGQVDIEMTLTTKCQSDLANRLRERYELNEDLLKDDAFKPKAYTMRIEQGNFLLPYDSHADKEDKFMQRYAYRLAFDKSPYPPRDEWKDPEDSVKMWEWKEFCSHSSPELKMEAQANKSSLGGNCVVC